MIDRVTIVMAYYDNANMLVEHLANWRNYSPQARDRVSVVIVDDASPNTPALEVLQAVPSPLALQLWRVSTDTPWAQDGARNIGMRECGSDWALMTDMDHVLPADDADRMLCMDARRGTYYMPNQLLVNGISLNRPHPNSYLMAVDDFWKMGGYDEDFCGWYGSDGNFRKCARGAGLVETHVRDFNTVVYRATDILDANTKKLGRKGSAHHSSNNPLLHAKARGPAYIASRPFRQKCERVL